LPKDTTEGSEGDVIGASAGQRDRPGLQPVLKMLMAPCGAYLGPPVGVQQLLNFLNLHAGTVRKKRATPMKRTPNGFSESDSCFD